MLHSFKCRTTCDCCLRNLAGYPVQLRKTASSGHSAVSLARKAHDGPYRRGFLLSA
ncbi:hypothetical protein EMIT0194MI4_80058 [Pseudomonas sp. IT-194MI4]